MNSKNLLAASRDLHLLVQKPGDAPGQFWTLRLSGLHQDHIKTAVKVHRKERQAHGEPVSQPSLKPKALQTALVQALGGTSYDKWREEDQPRLIEFLADNGCTTPANLLAWGQPTHSLTGRRVADRLFNSGMPLPDRLYTGFGSTLLLSNLTGIKIDLAELMQQHGIPFDVEHALDFCEVHSQKVFSLNGLADLTGRQLFINCFQEYIDAMINLLGDNLVSPRRQPPVIRMYNALEAEHVLYRRMFELFRAEIEDSGTGWVDVLKSPDNANIIFLKGADGQFDWVIRDQRDTPVPGNPYYPVFKRDEMPGAMQGRLKWNERLYFEKGKWNERIEHEAETYHYTHDGSVRDWAGYEKLIQRYLVAEEGYNLPRRPAGEASGLFVAHDLSDYRLMVSELITIDDFMRFYRDSDWQARRIANTKCHAARLEDLCATNAQEQGHLPASVTWYDAIAYCRWYEKKMELPVRLLDMDEWQQIRPDAAAADAAHDDRYAIKRDEKGPGLRYKEKPTLVANERGLTFLVSYDFGEWLDGFQKNHAPAVCAATNESLARGPLERCLCLASSTQSYHSQKCGFRMCYLARLDA